MPRLRFSQIYRTGSLDIEGNIDVRGEIVVENNGTDPALIVSGSQHIVPSNTQTGSIYIQGLGTFSDTGSNQVIDLGEY